MTYCRSKIFKNILDKLLDHQIYSFYKNKANSNKSRALGTISQKCKEVLEVSGGLKNVLENSSVHQKSMKK